MSAGRARGCLRAGGCVGGAIVALGVRKRAHVETSVPAQIQTSCGDIDGSGCCQSGSNCRMM